LAGTVLIRQGDEGAGKWMLFRLVQSAQWSAARISSGSIAVYHLCTGMWVANSIMIFADDTKLWTKIAKLEDSESLQQDLWKLAEWSKKLRLAFNPEKCKVMHIGHEYTTTYGGWWQAKESGFNREGEGPRNTCMLRGI